MDYKDVIGRLWRNRGGNKDRRAGLERNQALRNGPGLHHEDWASVVLSIPELDFAIITRRFPDLMAADATVVKNAWEKFLRSPESEPYRVRRHDGKRAAPKKVIVR